MGDYEATTSRTLNSNYPHPHSLTPGSSFSDTPGVFPCWQEFRVLQLKSGEEERPSGFAVNTNEISSLLVTGSEPGSTISYRCVPPLIYIIRPGIHLYWVRVSGVGISF
jgi:hypothetical protein